MRGLRTGVPDHGDGHLFARRDGRLTLCSWSSAPIYIGDPGRAGPVDGAVAGLVIVFQDAADRVEAERERREQMTRVQRANRWTPPSANSSRSWTPRARSSLRWPPEVRHTVR